MGEAVTAAENGLPAIRPVNDRLREAKDYRTFYLADNSYHYANETAISVGIRVERFQVQVESQKFDWLDQISIISFLLAFNMACETSEIYELAAL